MPKNYTYHLDIHLTDDKAGPFENGGYDFTSDVPAQIYDKSSRKDESGYIMLDMKYIENNNFPWQGKGSDSPNAFKRCQEAIQELDRSKDTRVKVRFNAHGDANGNLFMGKKRSCDAMKFCKWVKKHLQLSSKDYNKRLTLSFAACGVARAGGFLNLGFEIVDKGFPGPKKEGSVFLSSDCARKLKTKWEYLYVYDSENLYFVDNSWTSSLIELVKIKNGECVPNLSSGERVKWNAFSKLFDCIEKEPKVLRARRKEMIKEDGIRLDRDKADAGSFLANLCSELAKEGIKGVRITGSSHIVQISKYGLLQTFGYEANEKCISTAERVETRNKQHAHKFVEVS